MTIGDSGSTESNARGDTNRGSGRGGDTPEGTTGRILATAVHLNLILPLFVGILVAISTGEVDDAGVGAFWLTLLALLATLVIWFAARGMTRQVSFQALQAFWWALPAAIIAYIITLLAQNVIVAVVLLAPSVAVSCLAVRGVINGEGYRYPFVADRIEAGRS